MARQLNKILLVDDEPDIREVAKLALELAGGYQVETCSNGVEALERVADIAPDLILLDVMMPQMDGPQTLSKLQEMDEAPPVIFMTAKVQPAEVAAYKALGAIGVIAKPFDPMSLGSEVNALWGEAGL